MHPLNNHYFGPETPSLVVSYYNGTTIVSGYVLKQVGERTYVVTDGSHYQRIALTRDPILASYCAGLSTPPNSDYSIIENMGTIVASYPGVSTGNLVWKVTSNRAYKIDGTISVWSIGTYVQGTIKLPDVGDNISLTLGNLTTSSINFIVNIPFAVYIRGSKQGSTITATSSDATPLTISDGHIHGTFTSVGQPTITFVETLMIANGSPHTSTYQVNVNASDILEDVVLDQTTALVGTDFIAYSTSKTAGSSLSGTSSDGTLVTVTGGQIVAHFTTSGTKTLTFIETLDGHTHTSMVNVTVS